MRTINLSRNTMLFGVVAIIVFAVTIFWLTSARNKPAGDSAASRNVISGQTIATGITTRVVPTNDTTITINGKKVREGSIELEPGIYTVVVSHDGFATESRTVTVEEGDRIEVGIILTSNSPDTIDYYEKHPDDEAKAEGITGQRSAGDANAKIKALPFLKYLPKIERGRYSITYGQSKSRPTDPAAVVIYIEYKDDRAKQSAENWIKYQGYSLTDLEISYKANANL